MPPYRVNGDVCLGAASVRLQVRPSSDLVLLGVLRRTKGRRRTGTHLKASSGFRLLSPSRLGARPGS